MQIDKIVVLASALIKNKAGKYLLLKRSKVSAYENHWQFVEGKLEEAESPVKGLKREILEETGTKASKIKLIGAFHTIANVKGKIYVGFRMIFSVKIDSENIILSREHSDFGWFTKKQIMKLTLLPGVKEILNGEV